MLVYHIPYIPANKPIFGPNFLELAYWANIALDQKYLKSKLVTK